MKPFQGVIKPDRGVFWIGLLQLFAIITTSSFTSQIIGADFSVYDLINSVNQIRISRGLAELKVNSILMNVAQNHSEYQANNHRSSHSGVNGEIVIDRVAAAGYGSGMKIVAGENVANLDIGVTGMLPIIINEIWSDAGHLGAMINPKYQDIGVGLSSDSQSVYVTLNLAGVVAENPTFQPGKPSGTTGTPGNEIEITSIPAILPLITSTPMQDGSVYHYVGFGQTLGTIARIYQVDINEIVRLNQIEPDKILTGQRLLIKIGASQAPTQAITRSDLLFLTETQSPTIRQTISPTVSETSTAINPVSNIETRDIGIIAIYVLFGIICVLIILYLQSSRSHTN
jgi:LysM repeat protein